VFRRPMMMMMMPPPPRVACKSVRGPTTTTTTTTSSLLNARALDIIYNNNMIYRRRLVDLSRSRLQRCTYSACNIIIIHIGVLCVYNICIVRIRAYTRARRDRCAQSKRKRKIIYYKRLFSARARRVLHFYKFQNLYYAYISYNNSRYTTDC